MKMIAGTVLGAVAMFFYGFLYWGLSPLPYQSWQQADDDVALGVALRQYLPESGTYYVPSRKHDMESLQKLHEAGPVAMIHFDREGRPMNDPVTMAKGFALCLAAVGCLAVILRTTVSALPTYLGRVRLAGLVGLTGMILIDVGEVVWWSVPWEWKLHGAVYDLTACLVAGLVLAAFIKPTKT